MEERVASWRGVTDIYRCQRAAAARGSHVRGCQGCETHCELAGKSLQLQAARCVSAVTVRRGQGERLAASTMAAQAAFSVPALATFDRLVSDSTDIEHIRQAWQSLR